MCSVSLQLNRSAVEKKKKKNTQKLIVACDVIGSVWKQLHKFNMTANEQNKLNLTFSWLSIFLLVDIVRGFHCSDEGLCPS